MPRDTLDRQMKQIEDEMLLLSSMVEQATFDSVTALRNRDYVAAKRVITEDQAINEKRYAIENAILIAMATQQPFAHDLRLLAAMLLVTNELERMGDYAKGIAHNNIRLGVTDVPIPIMDIEKMAELATSMLHRAMTAFVNEDARTAYDIPKEDDAVDALFNKSYKMIINSMITNPAVIDHANIILWIIHNLERLADRVTNICERTVFIATGELLEMDSSLDEAEDELD